MPLLGYARVSTDGQTLDAQLTQLRQAGADQVFREKVSGARAERPQLARLMATMAPGDTVLVTRLDRLARSTRDLLNVLDAITAKGASFRSLGDAWADTTTPHGRLMLTVLGGLAEFERELIRARTGEGRERAKARGVRLGRRPKLSPHQRREALEALAQGTASQAELARTYNVAQSTISRLKPHSAPDRAPPGEVVPPTDRVAALRGRVLAHPATGHVAYMLFYYALSGNEDGLP